VLIEGRRIVGTYAIAIKKVRELPMTIGPLERAALATLPTR
jgi:hypothetical protein